MAIRVVKEMKLLSFHRGTLSLFLGTKFIPRFSRPQKLSGPFLSVQRRIARILALLNCIWKDFKMSSLSAHAHVCMHASSTRSSQLTCLFISAFPGMQSTEESSLWGSDQWSAADKATLCSLGAVVHVTCLVCIYIWHPGFPVLHAIVCLSCSLVLFKFS